MLHVDEIKRAPDDPGVRLQYTNILLEMFERSRSTFSPEYTRVQKLYDAYRAIRRGRYEPWANDVAIPLAFSVVQTDAARKLDMFFGRPGSPVEFVPTGPEDNDKARRAEKLIDVQLYDAKSYVKAARLFESASIYGVGIWQTHWRQEYGATYRRVSTASGTRVARVPHIKTGSPTLKFNAPMWDVVDFVDFFPFPGYVDIDDMPGVVVREYMDLEDVVVNAETGPGGEPAAFDARGVAELRASSPARTVDDERLWRKNLATGGVDERTWEQLTQFSKPVEILTAWTRVPRSLGAVDPMTGEFVTEFVITVADRKHLLRAEPNPYWGRKKPFGAYRPMEDPYYFHAPGKVQLIMKLQAGVNRLVNNRLDLMDLFVSPPWLFNQNGLIDRRKLKTAPGGLIPVNGPVDESVIRQMLPDLRGAQLSFQEVEQLWRYIQQASGIAEDISMGMGGGGSDRQTAREFLGRQAAVGVRLAMETRMAECQWLERVASKFLDMDRQFMPVDGLVRAIGMNAYWDPTTGQAAPPEEFLLADLAPNYDVRSKAASQRMSQEAEAQGLMQAVQVLGAIPPVAATINWLALVRQILPKLNVKSIDRVMNTEQQMLHMMSLTQGAGGGQGGTQQSPALMGEALAPMMGMLGGGMTGGR